MAAIRCRCLAVHLEFPVDAELFRHECCCHDCNSALWYAESRGGPPAPADHCADCCWLPNDFRIASGREHLGAMLNYDGADTTRFYCTRCWTLLFGDHPIYEERILVSLIASCGEFEGLCDIERMAPQARHFLKDLEPDQVAALHPWTGDPAQVYQGAADLLLENFPRMKAAGGTGTAMNAQILLRELGGAYVPSDAPRLSTGPLSYLQQVARQEGRGD